MKVGIALPQYGIDVPPSPAAWQDALDIARLAEAFGLDSIWLSDHPFAVGPDGSASGAFEPLVAAAALARRAANVRVGTLVLSPTMRSPGLVAHAFRALGSIAPKRIVAGLGAGWYEPEHRAFGLALPPYAERVSLLERTIDHLGDPRPSVLIGGTGSRLLSLAARSADAWNVAWDVRPEAFAELNLRLDTACSDVGRDPTSLARTVGVTVLVGGDERALDDAVDRLRARAAFLAGVDRHALAERIIAGTPAQCAERIAAYRADEVIAAMILRDDTEMLELFATEVAPPLRAA